MFSKVTGEILSEINNLDNKKVGSYKNIPTKVLQETSETNSEHLTKNSQTCLRQPLLGRLKSGCFGQVVVL